jgi:hypothetical protein
MNNTMGLLQIAYLPKAATRAHKNFFLRRAQNKNRLLEQGKARFLATRERQ